MGDVVRLEIADRIATVTLNRPDKLNAMSPEVFAGLREAGLKIGVDPDVRVVLLRGEGRAFSSGLDTSSLQDLSGSRDEKPPTAAGFSVRIPQVQEAFTVWARIPQPVVAAVKGYAFGAGLQLACAADLRVAAEGCTWSVFEINYGLVPDLGGTQRLPRLCGIGRAKDLIWTGRKFSSEEAERWGIVERLVADEDLEKASIELCRDLASRPPIPIRLTKELVEISGRVPFEEGVRREGHAQAMCIFSNDAKEAVAAAFEQRAGAFTGS